MHSLCTVVLVLFSLGCPLAHAYSVVGALPEYNSGESQVGIPRLISCYNDDSADKVNQDLSPIWCKLPLGRVLGRTRFSIDPVDCVNSPTVNLDRDGIVRIDGKIVYQNAVDPVFEVRRAPTDVVALLTEQGSLWVYHSGELKNWYRAQSYNSGVVAFVMARNGALLASTRDGNLVVNGESHLSPRKVRALKAAASGRTIALLDNGALRDSDEYLYQSIVDPIVDFKVAADGTVVWKSEQGKLGSTKTTVIYDFTGDPVIRFKISPVGRVAYVTQSGKLMRDHQDLSNHGILSVVDFRIHADGSVTATGTDGRELYFKP